MALSGQADPTTGTVMDLVWQDLAQACGEGRGEPVRRHSRTAGRCEAVFWRPFAAKDVGRFMLAAERFERANRKPGKRVGPLGPIGLEVLRELTRLVDFRTGRLEPAIATLQARLKRSRAAVVRALAALRAHGFLDWLRRYEPTGRVGKGPQVKQTSNAYRLSLPPSAARLLGHLAADPPVPDDLEHAHQARAVQVRAAIAALDPEEQGLAVFGDTPLGRAFGRLGRGVQQRESAGQTESRLSSFPKRY
jgi:hypothetical protein